MTTARAQYAQATRRALLDAGRRLFAERDYADLAAEELVAAAGLSRGALYHHFDGKRGLFEAVLEDEQRDAADRIRAAIERAEDPFDRADRGVEEFLEVCADRSYRMIVLLQGPLALGWTRWRELDERHLGVIVVEVFERLGSAGLVIGHRVELLAAAFYGSLTELSMTVATADDPAATRAEAAALQRDLLRGMAAR